MDAEQLVAKVQRTVLGRGGVSGVRKLAVTFRIVDSSGNGQLSADEFLTGLKKFGVTLSPEEGNALMGAFDMNGDGSVSLNEFMRAIRGSMNPRRAAVVDQAFAVLDKDGSGFVDLNDIRGTYDPTRHPQVLDGKKTPKDIMDEFLSTFDSQTNPDGVVTKMEFHEYYTGISASLDNDAYFEATVRAAWGIDPRAPSSGGGLGATQIPRRHETAAQKLTDTGKMYLQQYGAITNPVVFMDIAIEGTPPQRVVMELFADKVPKTAENFRALCTGEKGMGSQGQPLCYEGLRFHRIVPGFCVQSGDVVNNNGKGGESIYGRKFDDESFEVALKEPGLLAMANSGPNTNNSQFFFLMKESRYLDDRHVAFGKVIGNFEFVKKMETFGSDQGVPMKEIVIMSCGQLQ